MVLKRFFHQNLMFFLGQLQFDLWGVTPDSGRWDWDALKEKIKIHGGRKICKNRIENVKIASKMAKFASNDKIPKNLRK